MKKLDELGISPAPWKPADDGMGYRDILCNGPVTEDGEGENIIAEAVDAKDANIIAVAPELYDALQSLVEYIDRECIPCGETACELMYYAHNVLAKASGESEESK